MSRCLFNCSMVIAFLIMFYHQKLAAQNTSPYWSLAGNSNASSTASKLGTTNAINLRLFTNNIERVHINYTNGYVGIGTTAPAFRLHVVNLGSAIFGTSTGGFGVYGNSTGPTTYAGVFGVGTGTGVRGFGKDYGTYDSSTNSGYGVYGASSQNFVSGKPSTGVYGSGVYGVYGNGSNYGVYGNGFVGVFGNSTFSDGVEGYSINEIGVEGISIHSIGVYGGTDNSSSYAGYFAGSVFSDGTYAGSDRKLKQNISDVTDAMEIINKLQPKYYEFRQDDNYKLMNLPQGKHYGLIAQDVEEVLPGLVKETEFDAGRVKQRAQTTNGNPASNQEKREVISFKALNYTELIPIIVKAMQELNKKTDEIDLLKKNNEAMRKDESDLKDEIKELKALINKNVIASNEYELNNASLEQNTPNPVNGATSIRYHLPENSGNATIIISDISGKMIKSISLTSKGAGQLTLNSGTLSAGSYNYTLWMDCKEVDSKKMVITK